MNMTRLILLLCSVALCFQLQAQKKLADLAHIEEEGRWVSVEADIVATPLQYLANYKSELGLSDADGFLPIKAETDELGYTHSKFDQHHRSIKVEGAQYIVHEQDGRIIRSNGRLVSEIKAPSQPLISAEEAIASAILYTDAPQYYWQIPEKEAVLKRITDDEDATFYPEAELVYADRSYSQDGDKYRLAWKMEIHAMGPKGEKVIFIDARDGHILYELEGCQDVSVHGQAETRYHGLQSFMTDSLAPGVYRLHDNSRGVSIETYNMQTLPADSVPQAAVDFFDDDNYWTGHNDAADDAATDVHWGIQQTYDYFLNMGRNSYDGQGSPIISYVHVRQNWFNARWTGRWMEYGDGSGDPLTSIDVVAHELTHGVTGTSSGLVYRNESGALNESFSDIFGSAVEYYATPDSFDWFLGKRDFQFRSLQNPNQFGDPDTYLGNEWHTEDSDNGGVHTNSGVQNFWFYLLVEGGTGTNDIGNTYEVRGLGLDTAAAIALRNLTTYLTVSSTYADARYGAILAAEDLYGPCSDAVLETIHAWYAVGVGSNTSLKDMEVLPPSSPINQSCSFGEEFVTANLLFRRSGCRNVIPAGSKLPIGYSINNGDPIIDTITLAEDLIDGSTLEYTFAAPIDLSEPKYYDFDIFVEYADDENNENDFLDKFTVVSVNTLDTFTRIRFDEFNRPRIPPYFVEVNNNSQASTSGEAKSQGLKGFLFTGKNIQRNNIEYATNEEENFTKNLSYESRLCMCVDASAYDSVSIAFDLRQGFSDAYAQVASDVENPHLGVALRLIADEIPVSQQFHPDTVVNDTVNIDTFVRHTINLDHLAGTSFNLCFQGKHFWSKADDFVAGSNGDYSHLDDVALTMKNMVVGTKDLLNNSILSIYPNPAHDYLTVALDNLPSQAQSIRLIDLTGRVVDQTKSIDSNYWRINLANQASGIYFVEVQLREGRMVKKVIVE
jgi:Zn-dependent metalloprotease